MNAARNLTIRFFVNDKLDHIIQKKKGKHIDSSRATKKKKLFHNRKEEETNENN